MSEGRKLKYMSYIRHKTNSFPYYVDMPDFDQENTATFIAYADDYKVVVAENERGRIVRIPTENVTFVKESK